jgi:hypothetical protein
MLLQTTYEGYRETEGQLRGRTELSFCSSFGEASMNAVLL